MKLQASQGWSNGLRTGSVNMNASYSSYYKPFYSSIFVKNILYMLLDKIKLLTLRALMHDEKLMYGLVLKGGNALQLVYNITDRASYPK